MATGPVTQISDVIVPELFTSYVQQITEEKSRIISSGLVSRSDFLDNFLAGGGLTINVPGFHDLDNDPERISTDTPAAAYTGGVADPDPHKITTAREVAVRLSRNNSWSSADLTAALAGVDPMDAIANRVAAYWTRRMQTALVAVWSGVIADNIANDAGDYVYDASALNGGVFQDGLTNFTTEGFLDTTLTMGDSMDDLTAVMVHSVVYNRMQKNNLIDFIPDSEGRVSIPTFLGRQVIIDDGMPRTGSVYDTWLFGSGATQLGISAPKVPTALIRHEGAGNGGGQEVLYNRVEWSFHPTGHAFVGTTFGDGGPANTGTAGDDLDEAASWDRRAQERKMIKFAVFRTRES